MHRTNSMSRLRCTERLRRNSSLLKQFFVQVADSTSGPPLPHAGGGDSRNHPKSPPPNFDRPPQPPETKELNPLQMTTRHSRQIAASQTAPAVSPPALEWELPTPFYGATPLHGATRLEEQPNLNSAI